jgi:hypothetical protein
VGALVKGGGLDPQAVGAIHITDRYAIVEIAADQAQAAIEALRRTPLRGRKVTVRLDERDGGPSSARPSSARETGSKGSSGRPTRAPARAWSGKAPPRRRKPARP